VKLRPYKTTVIHAHLEAARSSCQGLFLLLVSTVSPRIWDRSAIGILFWWTLVSLAGVHRKIIATGVQNSTSNPRSTSPSSEIWCLVCCGCKKDCCTCFLFKETINFEGCLGCLYVDGQYFQHLWSANCNDFIPNVIGYQACWFIGKIRMPLAASGAPVAAKRRTVEPVNKIKVLPV
jgi:hypothetical protein